MGIRADSGRDVLYVGVEIMNFDLDHLLFQERKCRVCGETKNLMNDFYLTRKDRGSVASAYSYECKQCCICRVSNARKTEPLKWEYPDW